MPLLTARDSFDDLKKADLETALDAHLRANQGSLSKETSLAPYYKRIESSSPTQETAVVPAAKAPKQRRQTKAKDEIEG